MPRTDGFYLPGSVNAVDGVTANLLVYKSTDLTAVLHTIPFSVVNSRWVIDQSAAQVAGWPDDAQFQIAVGTGTAQRKKWVSVEGVTSFLRGGEVAGSSFDVAASIAGFIISPSTLRGSRGHSISFPWVRPDGTRASDVEADVNKLKASIDGGSFTVVPFSDVDGLRNEYAFNPGVIGSDDTPVVFKWGIGTDPADNAEHTLLIAKSPFSTGVPGPTGEPAPAIASVASYAGLPSDNGIGSSYPAKNAQLTESSGAIVVRAVENSDHGYNPHQTYSERNAYSPDGTRLLMGDKVYNAANNSIITTPGVNSESCWGGDAASPVLYGFNFQGSELSQWDKDGGGKTVLANFSSIGSHMTIGGGEGNPSKDGKYLAIMPPAGSGGQSALIDLTNGNVVYQHATANTQDWNKVSLSGKYYLVGQNNVGDLRKIWRQAINPDGTVGAAELVINKCEHMCLTLDAAGDDWILLMQSPMVAVRIKDGARSILSAGSSFAHLSNVLNSDNWACYSVYSASGNELGYCKIEIDQGIGAVGKSEGVSDSRNYGSASTLSWQEHQNKAIYKPVGRSRYGGQVWASANPDGTAIVGKTDWNGNGPAVGFTWLTE